jgi:hypothetical protein
MSLVQILQKPILGKKNPLIFVGDENNFEQTFYELWDSLTNHGELKSLSVNFDRVNLYNAIRGYLDDKKVTYKPQGKVSTDFLLRLDEDKDIQTLISFLTEVKKYDKIENRSHSLDEQKELEEFREQLEKYSSKYR